MLRIERVDTKDDLLARAARDVLKLLADIQATHAGVHGDGVPRLVLTGGGAGIGTLGQIRQQVEAATAPAVDWQRVHIFFGDERNLDVADPESNEGQARRALLDAVGVPDDHIHGCAVPTDDVSAAAAEYEKVIAAHAPEGFDLHLLGMGPESHINSLFPHTAAVAEKERLVIGVTDSPKPPAERVSLPLPAIGRAAQAWHLVTGAEKAEAAQQVVAGASADDWPAAGVPRVTNAVLYVSADAAPQAQS